MQLLFEIASSTNICCCAEYPPHITHGIRTWKNGAVARAIAPS
jgi:hypothetical protein